MLYFFNFHILYTAPLLNANSPTAIDGEYIVVFKDEVSAEQGISYNDICMCLNRLIRVLRLFFLLCTLATLFYTL